MKQDSQILQDDLNKLQEWEKDWKMCLNQASVEVYKIQNKAYINDFSHKKMNVDDAELHYQYQLGHYQYQLVHYQNNMLNLQRLTQTVLVTLL